MLRIADTARFDAVTSTLAVTRRISVTEGHRPEILKFTLPKSAKIGHADQQYSVDVRHRDFIEVTIQAASEVIFEFFLEAKREGSGWRLSGRSTLPPLTKYTLTLDFGRAVAEGQWRPDAFLSAGNLKNPSVLELVEEFSTPKLLAPDFGLRFEFQEPFLTTGEIDAMLDDMPVLKAQAARCDDAFKGANVILLLHYLSDLLPFVRSLEMRGLDPRRCLALYKDYPYTHRETVRATLTSRAYFVWGPVVSSDSSEFTATLLEFCNSTAGPILVIEDGGYVAPAFFRSPALVAHRPRLVGVVEQTTYGARVAESILKELEAAGGEPRLASPVISVARSETKMLYEPVFVAEAACLNLTRKLAGFSWHDTGVVVIGYGAIGRALVDTLLRYGARVAICEPSPLRLVLAGQARPYLLAPTLGELVDQAKGMNWQIELIIGTTGTRAVAADHIAPLSSLAPILVSLSSKQVEFDLAAFENAATRSDRWIVDGTDVGTKYEFGSGSLRVLGDGYPINFVSSDSVPNNRIDPIMGLLHVCGAELARPTLIDRIGTRFVGCRDADLKALPRWRLDHEVVDDISEQVDLLGPLLRFGRSP